MRVTLRNRRVGALVALGYLLGYLLVFVHFIAEQHAACAEHGGAHHLEVSEDEPSAPLAAGITAHPNGVEDHCHVLNTVRDPLSVLVTPMPSVFEVAPRIDIQPENLNLPPPRVAAVWRYAPKQSPPSHV